MKIEFANINENHIGRNFFLYGNYKKSFDVFCSFIEEKLKEKFSEAEVKIYYCSVTACTKIINNQCDLFGMSINLFCIRNIEDTHREKLQALLSSSKNNIFVLEAGDFRKSKLVTDYFMKSQNIFAVASFNNDGTLLSLCKILLPKGIATSIYSDIIKIINATDESLCSLFKKISLLLESSSSDEKLLDEYVTYKNSFVDNMGFIPFSRYLSKLAIKEKVFDKKQTVISKNFAQKNLLQKLLNAEINQKIGVPLSRSFLDML